MSTTLTKPTKTLKTLETHNMITNVSRRGFFQTLIAGAAGLALAYELPEKLKRSSVRARAPRPTNRTRISTSAPTTKSLSPLSRPRWDKGR